MILERKFNSRVAVAIIVACGSFTGCSTIRGLTGATAPEPQSSTGTYGEVAPLRAIGGSAVSGKIRIIDRGDGASVLVSMMNIPPGDFRIAIHENANCSSPNGFSAGPAWAPPGKRPQDLIPTQHANSEDRAESSLRVAGLRANGANGVAGRSVVVYAGSNVTEAQPDVPNEAIACGVFEPATPISF